MDSYVHGTSETPLCGETIGAAFDRIALAHGDRKALVVCDQNLRLRYGELEDDALWLHPGDIAVLDESDYCQIVGRLEDMLIREGENIFPREIEEFLFQHPAVEQAEVIGVSDPKLGEEICAWIKLAEGSVRYRRGNPRVLSRQDRALQDAPLHSLC